MKAKLSTNNSPVQNNSYYFTLLLREVLGDRGASLVGFFNGAEAARFLLFTVLLAVHSS
jgi:hypothetical protein